MLASELNRANSEGQVGMAGRQIGVLKHHTYDTILVSLHGALAKEVTHQGANGVTELVDVLKRNEIDGFVIDRFNLIVLYHHHPHMKHSLSLKEAFPFLQTEIIW